MKSLDTLAKENIINYLEFFNKNLSLDFDPKILNYVIDNFELYRQHELEYTVFTIGILGKKYLIICKEHNGKKIFLQCTRIWPMFSK